MKKYIATCKEYELFIQVSSNIDLDSRFEVLCLDSGEIITINGWLFSFCEVV